MAKAIKKRSKKLIKSMECICAKILVVTTLALGSQPRQGLAKVWDKNEPRSARECEGMNPHTPK
jgi:hypothetical protein